VIVAFDSGIPTLALNSKVLIPVLKCVI